MLTVLGLAAIAIAIVARLRWPWTPSILVKLGVLLALHLLALDVGPADWRPPIAMSTVFVGGLYLMALVALLLRSLGEQRAQATGGRSRQST